MEKILINEDHGLLSTICSELYAHKRELRKIKAAYEALELGPFTSDTLKLVLTRKAEDIVETQYWAAQETQLSTAGITNKVIRNNILNDCKGLIEAFVESVRELGRLRLTYNEPLKYIQFKNGDFELVPDYEEKILEKHCREWLTDPAEAEFIEAVRGIHTAYQNYVKVAKKVDATHRISQSFSLLDKLFDSRDGKWHFSPSKAAYYHRFAKMNMTVDPSIKHLL